MESKLQARIVKDLTEIGWYVLKVIRCNKAGHPDIEAFKNKRTVFIEVKDENKTTEEDGLQEYRHEQLREQGFKVYVFNNWLDYKTTKF